MATRGRKPKPTAMKELEGNPGKHPLNTSEPKPNKKAPACPKWLEPEAKKEWRRLAKQMEAIGILTEVDMAAFAGYCQAYAENFWNMIRNRGHYGEVRNALSVGEDTEGGFTVPDEFEKKLVEALEENNIFRGMATVIRTSSGTRKIPIAEDTGEASWIDEGEEIPESDTTFGQTMLSAYKLGTMIKISNELLNDSAFDLATYIARRFGVRMGNAEERAFITGDGVGKPLGLLAETGGAKVGVTAAQKDAVSFDEIFKLYYALKAPYRKKAQFLCNEALVLQLMTIKDNNGNYIWKPGLEIGKPDTLLNRPLKTSAFMPEIKGGSKVMAFGDYSYYWVADRQNRTFRRLNELYARTDQVGFLTTQRVDGKLILPEAVQLLQMAPQG